MWGCYQDVSACFSHSGSDRKIRSEISKAVEREALSPKLQAASQFVYALFTLNFYTAKKKTREQILFCCEILVFRRTVSHSAEQDKRADFSAVRIHLFHRRTEFHRAQDKTRKQIAVGMQFLQNNYTPTQRRTRLESRFLEKFHFSAMNSEYAVG